MNIGDFISYEWSYSNASIVMRTTGIVLAIKQHDPPFDRVQFSFELLEPSGKRYWYNVLSCEEGPKVISSC